MTHLRALLVLALPLLSGAAVGSAPSGPELEASWYDGRAEVCGYLWRGARYGEERTGEAVAVFVTEPFSERQLVKIDRPERDAQPVVTALKLNLVRDFQTGIYDYNTMVSCFVRADDLSPMKLSFSSAEWCGHVYEEIRFLPSATTVETHSYFQAESGEVALDPRSDGITGEQLLVWLRGLHGDPMEAGASLDRPFLASSFERRMNHLKPAWERIEIARDGAASTVRVPAGEFRATTYRARTSGGLSGLFRIEEDSPRRLLSWAWSRDGRLTDAGELTGSQRLEYWKLHGEGQERMRAQLGLDAPR